jgi:hypothetical protein
MIRNSFSRRIEIATNMATIVVAITISVVLVKGYLLPATSAATRRTPQKARLETAVGTNISNRLQGIDWRANNHTLLLVISTHCHFCTESAPFFRGLDREAQDKAKIVAVLPESVAEASSYLKSEGVSVDAVKTASLDGVGVTGTPTMLLVDAEGVVVSKWVGKIKPEEESSVPDTLRAKASLQKRG